MLAFLIPCDNHFFRHVFSNGFHFKLRVLDAMAADTKVFDCLFVGDYFAHFHLASLIALFQGYFRLYLNNFI